MAKNAQKEQNLIDISFEECSSTSDVKKTVKLDNTRQVTSKSSLNKHTCIANEANIKEDFAILLTSSPNTSLTPKISLVVINNPASCSQSKAILLKSADLSILDVNY